MQVIQAKYKSKPFGLMTGLELSFASKGLLLRLHVITGWALPEMEFQNILIDQLEKKISESYPNVNADEIEYAFRNCHHVQDYGKAMNLQLISEVIEPYLKKRHQLSEIEELAGPKEQKLYPQWQLDLEIAWYNLKKINKQPIKV
jgi:hypothetical protein